MSICTMENLKFLQIKIPLTYILTSAKLDATGQQWVTALSIYNFLIYYRSGKANANADTLSRIPCNASEVQN